MIENATNRGFPAAVNQAIAGATGNQILLLNNDTIVTTGWLGRLLRALHGEPTIGLVGPCSNCVSGPQQVEIGYESLTDLDGFAWDWGKAHDGQRVDVNRLVGFCLLIRRAVVDAIGLLDEQFGVGCFDDDDYCLRAIQAGYRAVIAADAFVHHFGERTFIGMGMDFTAVMNDNEQRFRAKWAIAGTASPVQAHASPALRRRPAAIRGQRGSRGRIAAGVQESSNLALHDRSRLGPDAAGLSGEHPALGRRDGDRRHRLGRRNAADRRVVRRPAVPFPLVHGSRFAEAADFLRRGIARSGPDESHLRKAYALLVYAEMRLNHHEAALEVCRQGRASFPNDTELRFREGVLLHELGRLGEARRALLEVLATREERHFSSVDRGLSGFKARQNLAVIADNLGDLVEAEDQWWRIVTEVPGYRLGWRGLGETLIRRGRFAAAEGLVEDLLGNDSLRVEGWLLKSRIALRLDCWEDVQTALDRAVAEFPDDPEVLNRRCQFLFEHGSAADAEEALKSLIAHQPHDAAAYYNLGTLLLRGRRYDEAACAYRQSLRYRTNHPATYLNLGSALKDGGRISEAVAAWEQALRVAPGDPVISAELARVRQVG